jgi:hypothetical protein
VVVPAPAAVAKPLDAPIVAICELLELHATRPAIFTVAPDEVVPIARNWLVVPGAERVCAPGIIAMEVTVPVAVVPLAPVTTKVALELTMPVYPDALAVMVVVPAPTPVANPEEVTVATVGTLDVQVTAPVTSRVDGDFALPKVPVAVNCAACPTATDCEVGDTCTASSAGLLPHPTTTSRQKIKEPARQARTNMEIS